MPPAKFYRHSTAMVEKGAEVGILTRIWHHAHVRAGATIGKACSLGKNVYIDPGVVIGDRCKIQNNCSLYDGVILGDHVFVGPHVAFTNDKHPRASGAWQKGITLVDDHASIGAHATIVCGVRIGRYAMIGSGAVVTADVEPYSLIYGNPGRHVGYVCEQGHTLERTPFFLLCRECKKSLTIQYTWKDKR
jgi:acetyltransferase-like isoleucine patch superfamily enzyme